MEAKSITGIHEILIREVERTQYAHKVLRADLEQKYNTEWLDNVITEQEKQRLKKTYQLYREARELLEDFENHQW